MKLSPQDRRQLKRLFGHRARFDDAERRLYSRDISNPPAPVKMMIRNMPDAVVLPQTEDEISDLLAYAREKKLPVIPRGGGTAGYGGAMPVSGGIVVDMTLFNTTCDVGRDGKSATLGAGLTFTDAEALLSPHGKALCIMPTSAPAATIGGWFCQGGAGLGSLRYGWIHDVVTAVRIVLPSGEVRTFSGSELDVVADMEGTTGLVTAVTMKIRDAQPLVPFTATFPTVLALQAGIDALRSKTHPWTMLIHTPEFNELRQEATGQKNVPKNVFSVVMAYEKPDLPPGGRADIEAIAKAAGGALVDDKKSAAEWELRFGVFRAKKLGPSFVPGEAVVPTAKVAESLSRIHAAVKSAHWSMEGIVAGDETVWFAFALDDERRKEYPAGFGAAIAMLGAAKKLGGRSLGTGVYMSREAGRIFTAPRIARVREFRKAVDPTGRMNPGKVFGAPIRFKPSWAPGPSVAQALAPAEPILKFVHGKSFARFQRRDENRMAYQSGLSAGLGAAGAGRFGAQWGWDLLVADADVGIRNASASARAFGHLGATPLGWVRWARDYVFGNRPVSRYQFEMLAGEGLAASAEAASELGVRYTDLLLDFKAHLIEQGFAPLAAHRTMVDNVAKHHNVHGRPHAERMKWAEGLGLADKGDTLFFADDTLAYLAPQRARIAIESLTRAGRQVTTLGAEEWSSGAALWHAGLRAAARDTIKHNIEAVKKSGAKEILVFDPYALHAFRTIYPKIAAEFGLEWTVKCTYFHEAIAKAVDEKKVEVPAATISAALHHPPVLTLLGVTEEMVTKAFTMLGIKAVPLLHRKAHALDVGASGGVSVAYPEVADRAARLVLEEARVVGATAVISSDPASQILLAEAAARIEDETSEPLADVPFGVPVPGAKRPAPAPSPAAAPVEATAST